MEHPKEVAVNVAMATPSLAAIVASFFGITLNEALAIISILFILLQIAYLIWKWVREARR